MYDIVIVGLGPAGSTLARLLDSRFNVLAIDKKCDRDDSFRKPCGGLLAPDAQKALSKFNLTLPKSVIAEPQIFAVKTLDYARKLTRYYRRFYINIDRHKFDMWLGSLIPDGVEVADGARCKKIAGRGDSYEVTYLQKDGTERTVHAKYVVGADGADSIVRKGVFPAKKIRQYTAIQMWYPETHPVPFMSCIFDRQVTDSYCWSVSKDGSFILGGAFPKRGSRASFDELRKRLRERGFEFGAPVKTEACLVSCPTGCNTFSVARKGAFLIGEAAGFISPSSLEGISYALDSAWALAATLNEGAGNPAKSYRLRTVPIRLKLRRKMLKRFFMYNPLIRFLIMRSGMDSIEIIKN